MKDEDAEICPVHIWRTPDKKQILRMEWRNEQNVLHRPDGPAVEEWTPDGQLKRQEYFLNGDHHRDDDAAIIAWDLNCPYPWLELWVQHGKMHREGDLPAFTERDPKSGIAILTKYYKDDNYHREIGPAIVKRDAESGITIQQSWLQNGYSHRNGDMPSDIYRDPETGIAIEEYYSQNNVLHRDAGPAEIKRDPQSGLIVEEEYWQHGNQLDGPDHSSKPSL